MMAATCGCPAGVDEGLGGSKDAAGASLIAVAASVVALGGIARCGGGGDLGDRLMERWLVALDLDDQGDAGLGGDVEMFFCQCSASSVTIAPLATPGSASSVCAAGISLDFSAMSICASTGAVSVANALSTCAAARSWKLSKLPRGVLPPSAMLPYPAVARAACNRAAWRRNTASTATGSRRFRI